MTTVAVTLSDSEPTYCEHCSDRITTLIILWAEDLPICEICLADALDDDCDDTDIEVPDE